MANFLDIDPEIFKQFTSLEMAVEVYDKDKFIAFKQDLLDKEFDQKKQISIWKDYHRLMFKTASKTFSKQDWELLLSYRFSSVSSDPTLNYLNDEQQIQFSCEFLDQEITARWFEHIFNTLIGLEEIRVCAAPDCDMVFLPIPYGLEKKYHSNRCRNRHWVQQQKKKVKTVQ